ncbi:hypothetical protein [Noviherbaspirillum sp.]|uniref:hypothetical protein n=1 Tax=Noviherbaspirillum sp. TaxID=1926288 RepID=UPI0025F55F07|nr:hypothetical protein [Noviherbaspirillum sp.]
MSTILKRPLSIVMISLFLCACGGGGKDTPSGADTVLTQPTTTAVSSTNPKATFVDTQTFSFKLAINPGTFTTIPERTISFYNLLLTGLGRSYSIATQEELNAFNQKVPASQMLSLDDLGTYTYFLVSIPGCSEFLEYASSTYGDGTFAVSFNHFRLPESTCLGVMVDSYYVFRARK